MSVHSPLPSVIHIGDADVPFVSSVKNLGVTLDSNLSMSQHITNTCNAAYIQIRHISSIRHLLTTQATQTLVCSLVLSPLDYCNSLLSGCPQYLLDKLQKVQNAAARLVCKAKKSDHIHPILETHQSHIAFNTKFQLSASTPSLEQPLSICPISFNLILQQDNYDLHLTHEPLSPPV